MANKKSDHDKPFTDINKYLPEVYRSDIGTSIFDVAFNRHLTKDDTTRVAGFIGEGNAQAVVDRRIKEQTPHRQGFQLAPTMVSTVGTVESALSFKAFQQQLALMGVDKDRIPQWGSTLQFNWVPPVNIDMLVNYQDYFWKPIDPTAPPQYLTVENQCNKATSKVESYLNMLIQRGETFAVVRINHTTSELVISQKHDDLFVPGFVFYTKDSSNINMQNKFWVVIVSTFDSVAGETSIKVVESTTQSPLIVTGLIDPTSGLLNDWFFNTGTNQLKEWTGSAWTPISTSILLTVSLAERLQVFRAQSNCACSNDVGWDIAQWDDGDATWVPITSVSTPTTPTLGALWYNIGNDTFNQYNGTTWNVLASAVSTTPLADIIAGSTGTAFWDQNRACAPQVYNEWANQNQWVHKSEITSTSGAKRAQLPILEYDSTVELNEWVKAVYVWKYRTELDQVFDPILVGPHRIELEPIKGYYAVYDGSRWVLYLTHKLNTMNRDVDYSSTFVPGYRFRITNDPGLNAVYTVGTVEYREITSVDTLAVTNNVGINVMCTIVHLVEPIFSSPQLVGAASLDPLHHRIEPTLTSQGDTWRGYHAHWLLNDQATTFVPASHQRWNLYRQRSIDAATALVPTIEFSARASGVQHQEFTVAVGGVTTSIQLVPALVYNATTPQLYATPNSNEVRVYVNGFRQYGTFVETIATGTPNYTVVGQMSVSTQNIPYVTGIVFNQALAQFDVVRIEVGAAPFNCMGNSSIPVRTIENEVDFTLAVVAGTQPTYRSQTQHYHLEQAKTDLNQYPLFNVYDVSTSRVLAANAIFDFQDDPDAEINSYIQRRIASSVDGKEYVFEQHLIDRDNNVIYAYRTSALQPPTYWYSPLLNRVFNWNGYAWTDRVVVNVATGIAVRRVIVSSTTPTTTQDKSLWFNTTTNKLYSYAGGTWTTEITAVVINGTDPMLRTIWRHGPNNEQYVPSYVDATLAPVLVGSPLGDWEVVDQWVYNSEHKNHKEVKYSQLITHFRSILESQPKIPGLQGGGIYTLAQSDFNYFLGGTIKEHNDSFDTLISAVNVNNVTPLGVLEFAEQEYTTGGLHIRDIFNKTAVALFGRYGKETFINFTGTISADVVAAYESSDFATQLYSNTSSYDTITGKGIRNWISTIPMFGLGPVYRPHLSFDGANVYLFHHDGHRTVVSYTSAERDRLSRAICASPDNRAAAGTLGVVSATSRPITQAAFVSAFGGTTVRTGVYWYHTGSARKTYRLEAYDVTAVAPSFYGVTGAEVPDGLLYYNTGNSIVYRKVGLSWTPVSVPLDISLLWKEVNFALTLGKVLLYVEEQLHAVTPTVVPVFDYSTVTSDPLVYAKLRKQRYDSYVSARSITAPLVNAEYDATDSFTWNYSSSVFALNDFPRIVNGVETPINSNLNVSTWQELYTRTYGTPYPHLEPWKLQGYYDKPTWWDAEYLELGGTRRWKSTYDATTTPAQPGTPDTDASIGMWENIRVGRVPSGRPYPNGDVSTGNTYVDGKSTTMPMYRYFSVNISNVAVGPYAPDAILPPYYSSPSPDPQLRSLFTLPTQVGNASADYAFGDVGPTEWMWSISAQSPYDLPAVAFLMQPAKFLHHSFGVPFTIVDGLQVDSLFKQVYSHEDALFHGDLYDTNTLYTARGLNQWYVNFNRYTGFDTNTEFRDMWAGWNPRMTYQFGGIVDTSSFDIASKNFDMSGQDYNIILTNSGVIADLWADAFEISLLSIPPAVVQYNNQSLWKMEINSLATIPRSISYYGVRHYPSTVHTSTNTFTANSFAVVGVNASTNRFFVAGDHTTVITAGKSIAMSGSTGNDGSYSITSVVYDTNTNRTRLTVYEPIPNSTIAGNLSVGVVLPWLTGDTIVMSSSKFLPAPIKPDTAYYIIRVTTNTFKLAETVQGAIDGNFIEITGSGDGVAAVSEVSSSFNVFGGQGNTPDLWFHYAVDKNDVRTYTPPATVVGMQTLINLLDGYASWQSDAGVINAGTEANDFDPITGRLVDWHLETERFIDWAYGLRQSRIRVSDKYEVSADTTQNLFTFTSTTPHWLNGTGVTLYTNGSLPTPLIGGAVYYVVATDTAGTIKLSTSANALDISAHVDITLAGSGQISIALMDSQRSYPRFEINPYRNNVWIDTPLGVLANVVEGPYADIRVQQTIFDQYGRPLDSSRLTVYRQDKQSRIAIRPEIANDVDAIYKNDPYNYIHLGGGHLFIEGFEHFLIFNDYTADGSLVYDPFLGLWSKRFSVDYFEKEAYTLRPTLGGYYLIDQQFSRNIEGAVQDMQLYYDTFELSESTEAATHARRLLGFKGRSTFLDLLNVNRKTQFLFYRGMIQSKGSVNSVKAYVNSRRFIDAKLDDFWAWKIAEFGDSRTRVYPEVNLFATDGVLDDVRLEFLANSESPVDEDIVDSVKKGFQVVSFATPERWYEFPEQKSEIISPLFLDAEVSSVTAIYAGLTPPTFTHTHIDYWFNTTTYLLFSFSGMAWDVLEPNKITTTTIDIATVPTNVIYIKHDTFGDDVRVLRKLFDDSTLATNGDYTTEIFAPGTERNTYTKVNAELVRINLNDFKDVMLIFTINPAKAKLSPAKLIDKKANAVVQQIPLWHPAKGHHSPVAIHNVDLQTGSDPAQYSAALDPTSLQVDNFWNQAELGTVWVDTSHLVYLPYYDDKIYPNINDRLYNWGKLAPWASVRAYEWVRSTQPPESWAGSGSPLSTVVMRKRAAAVTVTPDIGTNAFTTGGATFVNGDSIIFVAPTVGAAPTGLTFAYVYTVSSTPTPSATFKVTDPATGVEVDITSIGTGVQRVIKSFNDADWVKQTLLYDRVFAPIVLKNLATLTIIAPSTTVAWKQEPSSIVVGDVVDVYINGNTVGSSLIVSINAGFLTVNATVPLTLREFDVIDIVRPIRTLSSVDEAFAPDILDDGTNLVQWKADYQYSFNVQLTSPDDTNSSASTQYYYFWIEGSTIRDTTSSTNISVFEVAQQLETIPTPHLIVQRPKDDPTLVERYGYGISPYDSSFSLGQIPEPSYQVPVLYREAIIRGITRYLTDENRYVVRFTRDMSMRDDLRSGNVASLLKNKHEQWMLFRRSQTSTIARELWDRLTEALMGYTLVDSSIRVPALERELYDVTYGTDTQYGLGRDQSFVNKTLGIATLIAYLQDPANDFSPTDIDSFFASYTFDTPENIRTSMDAIYNTFNALHVNAMWFEVLHDSMSLRSKYKELLKTSWIALHGIRVLEVGGLFDD